MASNYYENVNNARDIYKKACVQISDHIMKCNTFYTI